MPHTKPLPGAPCAPAAQISDEIRLGREDDDETKIKAMEFFLPKGEQVGSARGAAVEGLRWED